ncbi:unnamed protein product [Cuscuta campestris]|uniref:F-box domain-containing protein n=1 Tax=Cuscuta campestris TaxID=132261 RepID=A0A484L643_9ASTE|nr:unnamed protein product [Cuscuta campestris]
MSEYLPPEIITQILSRLPVKSAVKCTAVCKAWYALIKHPSFVSTHLQQAAALQDDDLLLVCIRYDDLRYVYHLHRGNDAFGEYKRVTLPPNPFEDYRIVGTCNGLICLTDYDRTSRYTTLWNPSIRKHFVLPDFPLAYGFPLYHMIGLGFDSVSDDYKLLLIVPSGDTRDLYDVWLFSLNKCSWTRLTQISPSDWFCGAGKVVFVKGALHFRMHPHMILALDLSTEKFFEINIPHGLVHLVCQTTDLVKYEESIALVIRGSRYDEIRLWVMKEYGVDNSWAKVLDSFDKNGEPVSDKQLSAVFVVRKKGKAVLEVSVDDGREWGDGEVAMLDLNGHLEEHQKQHQHQLKYLGGPKNVLFYLVDNYVESLVLLDKGEEDVVVAGSSLNE